MTAVFSHGRLRLYLLKLLADGPKHGYELIRLLENRFLGLYAPSAGTIYPRLARMETEGLVTHTQAGGRKVYEITAEGLAELAARAGELADLETEIHASVADLTTLAADIEQQVSGSMRDLKRELREAARLARQAGKGDWTDRRWTDGAPEQGGSAEDGRPRRAVEEFDRAVGQLAGESRRLARRTGVGEPELRAATAVVASALTELRRLLHG